MLKWSATFWFCIALCLRCLEPSMATPVSEMPPPPRCFQNASLVSPRCLPMATPASQVLPTCKYKRTRSNQIKSYLWLRIFLISKSLFFFFSFFWPGTSPIRCGAQFLAICPYRFDCSSHMEPIQARQHFPS